MIALKLVHVKWNLDEPLFINIGQTQILLTTQCIKKKLTTRYILSHQTGFPNWLMSDNKKLSFQFEPGTKYSIFTEKAWNISEK
jgi:hypothetical protein